MLVPGTGQLYRGARRRGLVLLSLTPRSCSACSHSRPGVRSARSTAAWSRPARAEPRAARPPAVRGRRCVAGRLGRRSRRARRTDRGAAHRGRLRDRPRLPHTRDRLRDEEPPCGTACDRGRVLLVDARRAGAGVGAKDAWEWALVERLGPGEVAPLELGPRVLAGAKPARSKPWTTILLLGTDGDRATSAPAPTRSSSSPRSTAAGGPWRSASRATSPRCRWVPTRSRSRSR